MGARLDARLIVICQDCVDAEHTCRGACPCPIDKRDIVVHATEGVCPDGKFDGVEDKGVGAVVEESTRRPEPVPEDQWPGWAKRIAKRRRPGEAGVGDTFQRIAARWGGEQFKRFAKWAGVPCRCLERQAEWNAKFPYQCDVEIQVH